MDAEHISHCVRHILDFRIEEFQEFQAADRRILQVHIRGSAFLWHQVGPVSIFAGFEKLLCL